MPEKGFWFETKKWGGAEFGAVFTTLGLSSLFMPTITGIIADKWLNAEKLYGLLHIVGGITLCLLTLINDPNSFFWVILFAMLCYMPTISLSNSVGYTILKNNDYDVVVRPNGYPEQTFTDITIATDEVLVVRF